jgi:hypothetical protein
LRRLKAGWYVHALEETSLMLGLTHTGAGFSMQGRIRQLRSSFHVAMAKRGRSSMDGSHSASAAVIARTVESSSRIASLSNRCYAQVMQG